MTLMVVEIFYRALKVTKDTDFLVNPLITSVWYENIKISLTRRHLCFF
jgi:hypothetical protein